MPPLPLKDLDLNKLTPYTHSICEYGIFFAFLSSNYDFFSQNYFIVEYTTICELGTGNTNSVLYS